MKKNADPIHFRLYAWRHHPKWIDDADGLSKQQKCHAASTKTFVLDLLKLNALMIRKVLSQHRCNRYAPNT